MPEKIHGIWYAPKGRYRCAWVLYDEFCVDVAWVRAMSCQVRVVPLGNSICSVSHNIEDNLVGVVRVPGGWANRGGAFGRNYVGAADLE